MKKSLLLRLVLVIVAFVGITIGANAQVTTSSITGTIKDAKGALPGASVKATHTPTGTVYSVSTNSDGRFTIGGTRVGGPYTIEISFVGYNPEKLTDVYLKLGEPYLLNLVLADNSATLSEVKVVGQGTNSILNSKKNGASTVVTRQQIQNLPTITRSVNDITRLTPQGGGPNGSLGGGSYRSNNFSVDGANFNNQFGIGTNVPANGSPISIDALEQISINVTPYDVRQTGFTGGAINAVTRSGTNDVSAIAFYTMRGEEQQGQRVKDFRIPTLQKLDQKQYGFSLGGPIVKNKLFFFVNGEFSKTKSPGSTTVAATAAAPYGSASNIARPTAAFLDEVSSYLLTKYNYATGPYQDYQVLSNNNKLLARLDWNISKNHHFNIRYNQVESKTPANASSSTTGSGINYNNSRTSIFNLPFYYSNYNQEQNLYSAAAELTSSFGSKFTNTLRATYSHQNDPRSSLSSPFPLVDILDNKATGSVGSPLTTFGYEAFTYGNLRDVTTYTYGDDFNMALGKHNITLGLQAEFSTTKNGFQPFGLGFYTFNSWDDFKNGAKPVNYALTYSLKADGSQAISSFKFAQYSAYAQDEFNVSDRLKLTAGLRVERATYPKADEVLTNPLLASLSFNGEQMDTGVLPEPRFMFSPRFGFNWDVRGDRSLQVRGGSGIFTGRIPFVWIVAQSGNSGMLQFTQAYNNQATNPSFNPDPAANIPTVKAKAGTAIPNNPAAMAKDLRFPQTWKSSLAFDFKLPGGIVATLEGIYNKDLYAVVARNPNLVAPVALNVSGYPDNRVIYPNATVDKFIYKLNAAGVPGTANTTAFNPIIMENAKGGNYWSASAQLNKQFGKSLFLSAAYTHSEAKNYGDASGDQINNLWSLPFNQSGNSNVASLSFTNNVIPDRVIASVSYRKEYFKNLATTVSLFYEGQIQGRFSYAYSGDFNRDGNNNDLIYIPKDSEIASMFTSSLVIGTGATAKTYTATQQAEIFANYINQDKYLSEHKGEYAERNGAKLPWRNQVDFKLVQEVFKNIGGKKNAFQFTMDVFNFGNLLNKKWGNINFANAASILVPQNTAALVAGGTVKPNFKLAQANGDIVRDSFGTSQTISSTYYMQFGARFIFN